MHSMPLGPMSKHLKDLSPRSLHFSVPRAYRSLAHAMSATRHNLAALVDEQERSQVGQKKPIRVAESDMPTASGNKVLVRILARPVNPSDVASAQGIYPGFNRAKIFPAVPGLEGVGEVEENGPSASKFKQRQRVIALGWGALEGQGTWQQYVAVPEEQLFAIPEAVPNEVAAQAIVNPVTCYGFLDILKIPEGKWFLQNAANSEVGLLMVALCKSRGIRTINIVRREDAAQCVREAGGDEVIVNDKDANIPKRVKEITGGELAFGATDAINAEQTGLLAACVRAEGKVLVYGAMGGIASTNISIRDTMFRGVSVTGFWLSRYMSSLSKERQRQVVTEVLELLEKGVLKPRTGEKFPLQKVNEAIAASEKSSKKGKVLLEG